MTVDVTDGRDGLVLVFVGFEKGHSMGDLHDSQADQQHWIATAQAVRPPS